MVTAANAFIDLLAPDQKEVALLPVDSDKRPNWSNLPARIVKFDRNGVRVGDLRDEQLAAMITFLAYALSPDGFDTVVTVMAADGFWQIPGVPGWRGGARTITGWLSLGHLP